MLKIKRLYLFILQTFLPQFFMTFFICLFIVIMQFLWKYIDELVGKGLSIGVIGELFFYAALTMVPLALPLSILLASLMTFGNLGEHVELTAMKSSGVSLIKVMKPLIVLITFVAIGAFFFQNDVLPKAQVKMWTLLFSMRQKSPTLDIPEGAIYSQIPGYNLYIKHKNPKNDMLYSMMIYDVTDGVGYPRVVAADSGRLSMTQDKKHLLLQLYQGDLYEDMKQGGSDQMGSDLFRRESFHEKEILIPYDATFTRMDDNTMKSQYIGKNISELQHTIDSVRLRVDSAGTQISKDLHSELVCGLPTSRVVYKNRVEIVEPIKPINLKSPLDLDSLMKALPLESQSVILNQAVTSAVGTQQEYVFKSYSMSDDNFTIRRHQIEMQKKFTLSLACLIFFFIGAPLGAIIRKGGLGTSIVISVLLFIFYYIIDNIGYKLAKEGRWQVWEGIWLSSAVLLPLGIFLTRKAVNDSAVFNPDAYRNFFRRIVGLHQTRKLMMKEVIIEEVEPQVAIDKIQSLKNSCSQFLDKYHRRQAYFNYLMYGYDKMSLRQISREVDDVVDYMSNSRSQLVINKAMDFPIIRQLLTYHLTNYPRLGLAFGIIFPIGLAMYVVGIRHQKNLKNDISTIIKVCDELQENFINVEQTK